VSSSLVAAFLGDAISSIPGNSNFDQNVEFGTAFRKIVGEDAYFLAEVFFLVSCFVQACCGLVEAAQGLDGFIASFIFGSTYAIQLYPTITVVEWSGSDCDYDMDLAYDSVNGGDPSDDLLTQTALDCTPFAADGPLVITLGFVCVTAIFFPLSRGYLTDIIAMQVFVVMVSLALLLQFSIEFISKGLHTVSIPWIGHRFDHLTGVVLFNFAFSITVPSWLKEKKSSVNVNAVVWPSTSISSIVYIVFGWMAASAIPDVDTEVLKNLASPQVHILTRIAAALFGVTIIGAGVPVFCVMIKSALYR
jgi:hypothetical protein